MKHISKLAVFFLVLFATGSVTFAASPALDADAQNNVGQRVGPHTHSYTIELYYEDDHPHKEYMKCTICGAKSYTGSSTTFPHGSGTSGTCKKCGTHNYLDDLQEEHPHTVNKVCRCGDSYLVKHAITKFCTSCSANSKTATATASANGVLSYIDGDQGLGTAVPVPVTMYVKYTNEYKYPTTDMTPAYSDYPEFVSFLSKVEVTAVAHASNAAIIPVAVYQNIPYYNSSGNIIASQETRYGSNTSILIAKDDLETFTINNQRPAYTIVSGVCSVEGDGKHIECSVKTNF